MIRTELRKNQREAVRRALEHRGFAFFSQQRVGKTLTGLALADARKPDILFIVCPKGAIKTWKAQLREHLKIDWPCERRLIHWEALCRKPRDRRFWRNQFRHVWAGKTIHLVVDEMHRAKRRGSMQSRMVRSLAELSTWILGLSGTPTDKFEDYWALFDMIAPGVLEEEYEEFVDKYCRVKKQNVRGSNKRKYVKIIGYKNIDELQEIVQTYSYRITLREAQIEAGRKPYLVKRQIVRFELSEKSRKIYNELQRKLEATIRKRKVKVPIVLALVAKLQQIAGGFIIHTERLYHPDGRPKLSKDGKPKVRKEIVPVGREKLVELAKLITMNSVFDEKFVICAQYSHEIAAIGRRLTRLGRTYKVVSGASQFDGRFDTDCILLQIRSGEAIDLGDATTYVFYSWNWSYINYDQSKFRILKFNTRLVRYFYLMANNTVDEEIYDAVIHKRNIGRLVLDSPRYKKAA